MTYVIIIDNGDNYQHKDNFTTIAPNNMKKKLIELPVDLFKEIEKMANKNDRSVNKEIKNLLKTAIDNCK